MVEDSPDHSRWTVCFIHCRPDRSRGGADGIGSGVSGFIALIAFVIAAGCLAIVGIALFIGGLTQIAVALPEAFTLIGSGMILFAVGMVGVVLLVQLCFVAFPKMFRWIVKICKNQFI